MVDSKPVSPPTATPSSPGSARPAPPLVRPPSTVPVARPLVTMPSLKHGPIGQPAPMPKVTASKSRPSQSNPPTRSRLRGR